MRDTSRVQPDVHLAFSGGGFRASAFALGVLALLIDKRLISHVRSITSVSGGSFLNLFIDQNADVESIGTEAGHELVRDFAHRLATRSVYFANPVVTAFTIALLASVSVTVISFLIFLASAFGWLQLKINAGWAMGGGIISLCLLSIRNHVFVSAIRRVFSIGNSWRGNRPPIPADRICQHVVCATDLVRGEPVFFSSKGVRTRSRVSSNSHPPPDPTRSIAFSAAFPGLVKPFVVNASDLFRTLDRSSDGRLVLVDGGVINNLGTQWWEPASGGTTHKMQSPLITIVVDASVALPKWSPVKSPLLSTLTAASRIFNLIYSNSVRPRFNYLRAQGLRTGNPAIGISLSEDPVQAMCANMARDIGGKSSELNKQLEGKKQELCDIASRAQKVNTGLGALGHGAVNDLVTHGYYLAMIELTGADLVKNNGDGTTLEGWFLQASKVK